MAEQTDKQANLSGGQDAQVAQTGQQPQKKSLLREYTESIIIAVVLALIIRAFVVQAFKIPSGSMEDTLLIGDHLLVSKFIYGTESAFHRQTDLQDP